jgi:protein TonB
MRAGFRRRLAFAAVFAAGVASVSMTYGQARIYDVGEGVTLPSVVREVRPDYTPAALQARIEGTVQLKVIVEEDGSVGEVAVERSLDEELDQQAVAAMKRWEFKPGRKDDKPVAVRIHVQLRFTLR